MTDEQRFDRMTAELESMRALQKVSTIFSFEATGEPADRYTVTLRGKGPKRETSSSAKVELIEQHQFEIRLPYSFPRRPPDVRWITPLFHPNVSFSGFINLREIGLPWDQELTLDLVCERLWDVARCAYIDHDKAANYAAKNWFQNECNLRLPVDARPLRDTTAPSGANIISYERRGDDRTHETASGRMVISLPDPSGPEDVFYIGEETAPPARPREAVDATTDSDDNDILYIGYD